MDLMDLLQFQMSDRLLDGLSSGLGINDKQKTTVASNAAMSFLMNALSNNASDSSGLSALAGALDKDHDGSILDDIIGLATGSTSLGNNRVLNGAGILAHVLGGKQNNVVSSLSNMSGLSSNQSLGLLMKLAPVVLNVLGRLKKQKAMDSNGLGDFLKTSQNNYKQQNQNVDLITKILDRDGDGNVMDEVTQIGLKALGGFFGRR